MKVSIITACLNSQETIEDAIRSVISQRYPLIEYIIVDGKSTDGTLDIIKKYENKISSVISEEDNSIYEAMNKGIILSTGEIIGFLNSDDLYYSNSVIETVVDLFKRYEVDCVWGDLVYVDVKNTNKIIRFWQSREYKEDLFKKGWMPPHPAFFAKKEIYTKYGLFNTNFKVSADYEILLRFLWKYRISSFYIPEVLIKMRAGGRSNNSLKNIINKSFEDYLIVRNNNLGGLFTILQKNFSKLPQFFLR